VIVISWVLSGMIGLTSVVVPGIATEQECRRLAIVLQVKTPKCNSYQMGGR
jgi:hypothetical protein